MKARILVLNPCTRHEAPAMPSLLLQVEDRVVLYSQGWTHPVKEGQLAELTERDLTDAGLVGEDEQVRLSDVRELPDDDLMSPETLQWIRHWWLDAVREIPVSPLIANAS